MSGRRTYKDACGVGRALDRVGERWALMIVREMLLGPKRFTDLRAGLPGLSPDVLAQRLRELEETGVVARRKLPPPAASQVYELTAWGRELEPVVIALGRWGARAPGPGEGVGMSFDSHIMSLRTLFDPARADGLEASLTLLLGPGEQPFRAEVHDGTFEIVPGVAAHPDATLRTDPTLLIGLIHDRVSLAEAEAAHDVVVTGDRDVLDRFLGLFPLPAPALAPT